MRFRIQTKVPLPELKAWYTPGIEGLPVTISDLKTAIFRHIPSLRTSGIPTNTVRLTLDDFELLDDSPLEILRDDDLICIVPLPTENPMGQHDSPPRARKRKRNPSISALGRPALPPTIPSLYNKKLKKLKSDPNSSLTSPSSPSSSFSSSSSSSSSPSPSSRSSSSQSSYSSSFQSSSSLAGPPVTQPSKITKVKYLKSKYTLPPRSKVSILPTVPPGFGKPQTHSRNVRRRIKKKHDRQTAPCVLVPSKHSTSANSLPLGPPSAKIGDHKALTSCVLGMPDQVSGSGVDASESTPTTRMCTNENNTTVQNISTTNEEVGVIMMATLRNKNKKKGFKQSMSAPLPRKIVFDNESGSLAHGPLLTQQPNENSVLEPTIARLITPSKKQDRGELPPRMFITTIDVERTMWKKGKQKRQKIRSPNAWHQDELSEGIAQVHSPIHQQNSVEENPLDWDCIEKEWDNFAEVNDIEQLMVGTLIGWKGLALNPQTFSPEILLSIASIVSLSDNTSKSVTIRLFPRPCALTSLSPGLIGPMDDEAATEEYAWSDIIMLNWKVITI